jgi:dTDP-4-amino-4,6-dideoxygalactose transaminase
MDPLLAIAERHGLWVVEDAAQAIGAEYRGRRAGSMGSIGCFSFFPSKNLGAFGDAGAVTTNDDTIEEKLRVLRVHGGKPKYHHRVIGGNFRLDAIQAAVVRVKLKYLDAWTEARQRLAQSYGRLLAEGGLSGTVVETPTVVQDRHIFNQYVVRVADRDALQAHLNAQGIGNAVYYPIPMHLQECFAYLGYVPGSLPQSELAAKSTVAIPLYPELTAVQQRRVVDSMVEFYASGGKLGARQAA